MCHEDAGKSRKGASQLNCKVDPQAGDRVENEAKTQSAGQLAGGRVNGPQAQEIHQTWTLALDARGTPDDQRTLGERTQSQHVSHPHP